MAAPPEMTEADQIKTVIKAHVVLGVIVNLQILVMLILLVLL